MDPFNTTEEVEARRLNAAEARITALRAALRMVRASLSMTGASDVEKMARAFNAAGGALQHDDIAAADAAKPGAFSVGPS